MTAREEMLKDVAARLARLERPHTVRVAIDGVDAAGKTTLADELADRLRALERPVIRSGIDHFHNPRVVRYAKGSESPDGYYRDSHDLDRVIELLLSPLGTGGTGHYRAALFDHRRDTGRFTADEGRALGDSALRWNLSLAPEAAALLGLQNFYARGI